jgi:4'-phosphopantetheinyl transferase
LIEPADSWVPGPHQPRLPEGAVHVWRADLDAVSDALHELLSEPERERAERILGERERRRWTRSHGLLRALLGRYLDADPRALRFGAGENGKPMLLEPSGPCLNLSHSDQLALYAFSRAGAVGVDVQAGRGALNEVAIAARLLGTAEAERLEALDPASRRREFLRAWVRHEARLKCRGTGIGGDRGSALDGEEWIAELDVGPDAAGAVALQRAPRELLRWDWLPAAPGS